MMRFKVPGNLETATKSLTRGNKMIEIKHHIHSNPEILFGKPVIKGTRVPVDLILEKLAYGETIEELLQAYPHVKKENIYACLMYASLMIKNESEIYYSVA